MTRARIPNINVPGRGAGRKVPSGYIVGRASGGHGRLELLSLIALEAMGIATKKSTAPILAQAGFRFYVGGRPLDNEEIGSGNWGHPVIFQNGVAGSVITSLTPAAATAVWHIKYLSSGVYTIFGTITFATAALVGVLDFPTPTTIPAGEPVSLWAPTPQDATLASITGTIMGAAA